jgi:hypothetical protein
MGGDDDIDKKPKTLTPPVGDVTRGCGGRCQNRNNHVTGGGTMEVMTVNHVTGGGTMDGTTVNHVTRGGTMDGTTVYHVT